MVTGALLEPSTPSCSGIPLNSAAGAEETAAAEPPEPVDFEPEVEDAVTAMMTKTAAADRRERVYSERQLEDAVRGMMPTRAARAERGSSSHWGLTGRRGSVEV